MILRITIENLYSFKDETVISFVAGKDMTHKEHISCTETSDGIPALKTGIIYGANASGKSNIIRAVSVIKKIALKGVPKRLVEPFKLVKPNNKPSKVEIEFKAGSHFYAYGVVFSIKGISEEWLYEIDNQVDKEIYTRKVDNNGNLFTFGKIDGDTETEQLIRFISQSTPITDSFLAEYVKRNGKGLSAIDEAYRWMKENLKIIYPKSRYKGISVRTAKDKDFAEATKSLLEYFNTGIVDVRLIKISKEELELPKDMINDIMSEVEPDENFLVASTSGSTIYFFEVNKDGIVTIYKQTAIHHTIEGEEVSFEMDEESDGSLRLLDFIPMLIDLSMNETVYLVDEIDRSMHPMLSYKLLEYYLSNLDVKRNTQLICSTHESNLLNLKLIRPDEVWFVEKGPDGASHLTSLAEYKPREDKDIQKGYLQGRYGAIPFFSSINKLNW